MSILCLFGFHKLYEIGRPNEWTDHLGCRRCDRQWGVNHLVQGGVALPWRRVRHLYEKYEPARDDLLVAAKMAEELIRNGGIVPIKGLTWQALTAAIAKAEGQQ